jgi:type VI secretion system secreted protein Hcp
MPVYLKYEGVKGTATAKGHEGSKGWIEIQSCQFGVNRHVTTPTGATRDREASAPSISEIVVTKMNDDSSVDLFKASLAGEGKKSVIHFVKAGENQFDPYLELTLEEALISSFSVSSGGDRPMESLSINFTKIEYKATPYDEKGKAGSPATSTYNLATGTKS